MDSPEGQHGTSKEPGRRLRDRGLSALLLLALLLVVLAGFSLFGSLRRGTEIIEIQQELIEIQDSRIENQEELIENQEELIANQEELIANLETLIETRDEIMELLGARP